MLSIRKVLFRHKLLLAATVCLGLAVSAHSAEDKVEHDRSKLSVFVQPSVSFLDFEHRKYFQSAVDTIYQSFLESAVTEDDSLNVAKQDFQKVNFCFPISAGIQYQLLQDHFISAGIGFIYDNESIVLKDRKDRAHNYSYTIQGVPLFLEYRLAIPKNFMSLSGESLFSFAVRWYWVLPGTEIYTTWGMLEAETPITGAGFGVSFGYLVASWKNFNVYGDVGISSISVKSKKRFADIVPDGPDEKAKWNIGGLTMQIRVSFGLWNQPKVEEDSTEATKKMTPKEKMAAKIAEKKTAKMAAEEAANEAKAQEAGTANENVANDKKETAPSNEGEKVTPEE